MLCSIACIIARFRRMSIEIYKKVRFLYNPNAGSGITRLRAGGKMDAFLDFSIVPGSRGRSDSSPRCISCGLLAALAAWLLLCRRYRRCTPARRVSMRRAAAGAALAIELLRALLLMRAGEYGVGACRCTCARSRYILASSTPCAAGSSPGSSSMPSACRGPCARCSSRIGAPTPPFTS